MRSIRPLAPPPRPPVVSHIHLVCTSGFVVYISAKYRVARNRTSHPAPTPPRHTTTKTKTVTWALARISTRASRTTRSAPSSWSLTPARTRRWSAATASQRSLLALFRRQPRRRSRVAAERAIPAPSIGSERGPDRGEHSDSSRGVVRVSASVEHAVCVVRGPWRPFVHWRGWVIFLSSAP